LKRAGHSFETDMRWQSGTILYVGRTNRNILKKPLDTDFARENIGGLGFGIRFFLDLIHGKPDFDALSPDNPFVLMTGPLTGMMMNGVASWLNCCIRKIDEGWIFVKVV
jgi:aldehyde:ferredoxin oxidoreductase